jgi:putative spermidine/putrescine transport system substrate-binding protein
LWQEFLYSDQGQNLWLKGGARPVLADEMSKAGTIDKEAYAALPPVNGTPVFITEAQRAKITDYLNQNWQKEMG